jgi:heme/copper-type cytochrome/quinol oxidase subunit 3
MAEARTLTATLPVHGRGQVGTGWWGMLCLFATEGIVFAYLIFAYAYLGTQGAGAWPPAGPPSLKLALPATVLLVGSSVVLEIAKRRANAGKPGRGKLGIALAILMGAGFVALEGKEWAGKSFGLGANSYSSAYYLTTGVHLAHVAVGLLALVILLFWSLTGQVSGRHVQHRALATLYWHFVDVVWLFVFTTIYLSPRLT